MLKVQPSLQELRAFIDSVPDYPVSAEELVDLADTSDIDPEVAEFYRAFPAAETFTSKEDLLARSEQVTFMHEEEQRQPLEFWRAPEED